MEIEELKKKYMVLEANVLNYYMHLKGDVKDAFKYDFSITTATSEDEGLDIPKSFKLFGTTIDVVFDEARMDDKKAFGTSEYGKSLISLSKRDGLDDLSEGKIMDTFYHERTHMILNSMNENELSRNEKFVDVFSKLLRQADETAEY